MSASRQKKLRKYNHSDVDHVLGLLATNPSMRSVAAKENIPYSTLRTWKKNNGRILTPKKKKTRLPMFPELEKNLYDRFMHLRASGMSIRSGKLGEMAREIAKEMGIKDFKASVGWIAKFTERHKLSERTGSSKKRKTVFTEEDEVR